MKRYTYIYMQEDNIQKVNLMNCSGDWILKQSHMKLQYNIIQNNLVSNFLEYITLTFENHNLLP